MAYQYITQFDSPNYTPGSQTASVWGVPRQLRDIVIHWWGDPATNPTFEGVIAHFQDPNSQVSAHYVATGTGRRVACLVSPADNAWATDQENPYSIAIECDPRCRPEDYDVVAELIADIRSAYGDMPLKPHSQFWNTACPGNWDLQRLDALSRTKVSHAQWGQVTDVNPNPTSPATATADQVTQDYLDILERSVDPSGLQHYTTNGMTNDQVRLDLLNSTEYKILQNNKAIAQAAQIAQAATEAAAAKQPNNKGNTTMGNEPTQPSTPITPATPAQTLVEPTQNTQVAQPVVSTGKAQGPSPNFMQRFVSALNPYDVLLEKFIVTFGEAFLTTWAVNGGSLNKLALAGAVGAGFSAGYNVVLKPAIRALTK